MIKAALEKLGAFINPVGPIGEIISPSEVYKSRAGLPIASPHVARANLAGPAHLEHTLAATRFVSIEEVAHAPKDRVEMVSAYVEAHWAPVYAKTDSADLATILLNSQKQIGWTVTQRESEQSRLARRAQQNAEDFVRVLQSTQIQASDAFYDGIYETIPGNDPIILDGEILRGEATFDESGKMTHDGIVRGTMITKGRAEYKARTKGFITWDRTFAAQREAAQAEYAARPVANVRRAMESYAGELPMHRPVGINFRKDKRAV